MATRTENTITINQPVGKVHQVLTTEAYWAYIAENLSPEAGEVNEFTAADGGATATLLRSSHSRSSQRQFAQ